MNEVIAARERDYMLYVECYCGKDGCPVRTVTTVLKDYDEDPRIRGRWLCPVCRSAMKVHHALTRSEHRADEAQKARGEVALQMYERDIQGVAVPVAVMLDDRLPPTPAGWWKEFA